MSAQKGTASSRLLSMKFMQRAAAAESPKPTPTTPGRPPAKRIRMSNDTSTPVTPAMSDQQRVQAAKNEDELQRSAVIERLAAEAGETRWVLDVNEVAVNSAPLNIIQAGFADLDSAGDGEDDDDYDEEEAENKLAVRMVEGRMVFGQVKNSLPAPAKKQDSNSESDSENESSENSDEDPVDRLIRHESDIYKRNRDAIAARKEEKMQEQQRLAALRRKKGINLNSVPKTNTSVTPRRELDAIDLGQLKSISGGTSSSGPRKSMKGRSYKPLPKRKG